MGFRPQGIFYTNPKNFLAVYSGRFVEMNWRAVKIVHTLSELSKKLYIQIVRKSELVVPRFHDIIGVFLVSKEEDRDTISYGILWWAYFVIKVVQFNCERLSCGAPVGHGYVKKGLRKQFFDRSFNRTKTL